LLGPVQGSRSRGLLGHEARVMPLLGRYDPVGEWLKGHSLCKTDVEPVGLVVEEVTCIGPGEIVLHWSKRTTAGHHEIHQLECQDNLLAGLRALRPAVDLMVQRNTDYVADDRENQKLDEEPVQAHNILRRSGYRKVR